MAVISEAAKLQSTMTLESAAHAIAEGQADQSAVFYEPGVNVDYYKGNSGWKKLPNFDELEPVKSDVLKNIDSMDKANNVLTSGRKDDVAAVFWSFIDIPEAGEWKFATNSDDGSKLYIDGELVVDNDGLHGTRERDGKVALDAGQHKIRVEFFERGGWSSIQVKYGGPGREWGIIPADAFSRQVPRPAAEPEMVAPGARVTYYEDEGHLIDFALAQRFSDIFGQ